MKKITYLLFLGFTSLVQAQFPNLLSKPYLTDPGYNDAVTLLKHNNDLLYIEMLSTKDTGSWNTNYNYIFSSVITVYSSNLDMSNKTELFSFKQLNMYRQFFPMRLEASLTSNNKLLVAYYDGLSSVYVKKMDLAGNIELSTMLNPIMDFAPGTPVKIKEINDTIHVVYATNNNINWIQLDSSGGVLSKRIFPWDNQPYNIYHYLFEFLPNGTIVHEYKIDASRNGIVSVNSNGTSNWAYTYSLDEFKPMAYYQDSVTLEHYLLVTDRINSSRILKIQPDFSAAIYNRNFQMYGASSISKVCFFNQSSSGVITLGVNANTNSYIINMTNAGVLSNPIEVFDYYGLYNAPPQRTPLDMILLPSGNMIIKNRLANSNFYYHIIKTIDINNPTTDCYTSSTSYSINNFVALPQITSFTPSYINQYDLASYGIVDSIVTSTESIDYYNLCTTQIGIEENTTNTYGIFPNPSISGTAIEVSGITEDVPFAIISINGAVVQQGFTQGLKIYLNSFSRGMYFIRFNNSVSNTCKLIIQ